MRLRCCLAETEVGRLEGLWRELDELWVRNKYHIDIVHDIEWAPPPFHSRWMQGARP